MDFNSPHSIDCDSFSNIDSSPFDTSRIWPEDIGTGGVRGVEFSEDFRLKINESGFLRDYTTESEIEHSSMEFCFCISGKCMGEFGSPENRFMLESGRAGLFFSKRPGTKIKFLSKSPFRSVVVQVNPSILGKWFRLNVGSFPEDLKKSDTRGGILLNRVENTKLAASMAVEQILQCPFSGDTGRLYLESKAMELTAILINQIFFKKIDSCNENSITAKERDRIYYARDLLIKDLENPPSLSELSTLAGVNKNYLNSDFKKVFGTTVFDYLRNFRLEKAREWIEEEGHETSLTEIAFRIGYSQPACFTRAFKKKFGVPPQRYPGKKI